MDRDQSSDYPLTKATVEADELRGDGLPSGKREPRCGPFDEREDGVHVCRKCGRLDALDFLDLVDD